MSRTCFINCGIGPWYSSGTDRLRESLEKHKFQGDVITWKDWPEIPFRRDSIYNCKAAAFQQVIDAGYTTIIWADSSIFAQDDVAPFVEHVTKEGLWIGQSGYNGAQTCTDACLRYFGISRNHAERMRDAATGLFGVNIEKPFAKEFIETWIRAARDGAFAGSRLHDGQSNDPRFLFGRQDQSVATIILGKNLIKLSFFSEYVAYKWDSYSSIFRCEGM